jgi:hypothetical protein
MTFAASWQRPSSCVCVFLADAVCYDLPVPQSRRGLLGYVGVGAGAGVLGYILGSQTANSGSPSLGGLTAEDRKVGEGFQEA